MLVCTISRTVWFSNNSFAARICDSSASWGAGLAPQVTTQWDWADAFAAKIIAASSPVPILVRITRLSYRGFGPAWFCGYHQEEMRFSFLIVPFFWAAIALPQAPAPPPAELEAVVVTDLGSFRFEFAPDKAPK